MAINKAHSWNRTLIAIGSLLPDSETMRSARRPPVFDVAVLLLATAGLALALLSSATLKLFEMDDLGVFSVLPWTYWLALAMICVAFALGLARAPVREALLGVPVGALAVALFSVVPIASTVPRDHVSLRHIGIMDQLATAGWADGTIDAYFNWPGFFAFFAFLSRAAGDPDLVPLVRWAPLLARLALMAPLLLLMRSLVSDRRVAWVAVWIVLLWDWVDQDYFSPQTFALVLHLVVLSLVASWLLVPRAGNPMPSEHVRQRIGVYLVAILLCVAIVPAHQLTPVVTTVTLVALVLVRRLPAYGVALICGLTLAVWMVTGASAYLSGHDAVSFPNLSAVFGDNVGSRVSGSDLHAFVVRVRLVLTAALWLLAGLGVIRSLYSRRPVLVPILIAAVPFAMLPLQEYGGEMLLRAHLLSLPAMALLAAFLLAPPGANRLRSALAVLVVSLVVLPVMIVARFGNDRLETFTPAEVASVEALYREVPEGGLLVSAVPYTPWRSHDYATYRYDTLQEMAESGLDAEGVWEELLTSMKQAGSGGVLVTSTAYEAAEMLGSILDPASVESRLAKDPRFDLVYGSDDGRVYAYRGDHAPAG